MQREPVLELEPQEQLGQEPVLELEPAPELRVFLARLLLQQGSTQHI